MITATGLCSLKLGDHAARQCGELSDYKEHAVLPDNIACYLDGYHADPYASHGLPALPEGRSRINVHGII